MDDKHMQELETHPIFPNVLEKKKCGLFAWRNVIEGIVCVVIIILIVRIIPFVDRVAIILGFLWSLAALAICLRGIHNRSVTQFLVDYISFKKNRVKYHLRSVDEYENKQLKEERRRETSKLLTVVDRIKEKYYSLTEEE